MSFRLFMISLPAMALVSACGGGSGGSDNPVVLAPVPLPANSQNLGQQRVALPETQAFVAIDAAGAGVSGLEGFGTVRLENGATVSPNATRLYFQGTRDAATDAVTITDTQVLLRDTDGDSGAGDRITYRNTDPNAQDVVLDTRAEFTAATSYDFARQFRLEVGGVIKGAGIIGVSTGADNIPSSGTVTYIGNALTREQQGPVAFLRQGTATVDVSFNTGLVNVVAEADGNTFDNITATGMQIDGNHFSGGTVTINKDGMDITDSVTGGTTGTDAAGFFFGPGAAGEIGNGGFAPAEVGGVITAGGATRTIESYFIAD